MIKTTNNFGLNEKQIKQAEENYELIEPLLEIDSYLSNKKKREYREYVCQKLSISNRSLRRYIQKYKKNGIIGLARRTRSDSGTFRVFQDDILKKSIVLLNQNPYRSVGMLIKLMANDEDLKEKVKKISESTLYFYLKKAGYNAKNREKNKPDKSYRSFEADFANQLWQGDARHGIPLINPGKSTKNKMTYCFVWMDDFSRKILFAKYYWDEKIPSLDDSYKQTVLRWGISSKIYVDNGSCYRSGNFSFLVDAIGTSKIHHPPYCAWCKGKVEFVQKIIKKYQREAMLAGIKTIEELNETLNAWIEVEYNNKIHSSTGQTPNDRYKKSIEKHPAKRIEDLIWFESLFLWKDERVIDKYKKISFKNNLYKIRGLAIGERIEIRYDPFDLTEIQVFYNEKYYCNLKAYKVTNKEIRNIPEEKKNQKISEESKLYFSKIREKHLEQKKQESNNMFFFRK